MSIDHVMTWLWILYDSPFMYITGLMLCVVVMAAVFSQAAMMFRKARSLE